MKQRHAMHRALLLGGLLCCAPALGLQAQPPQPPEPARAPGSGLQEIPDAELGLMRGRFAVGDNRVLWFGVSMISNWQTQGGQLLQGRLDIGFDLRDGAPTVSFTPHVTITDEQAPMPVPGGQRSVDGAGLANVSGLVQSVQVAGDRNAASNLTSLTLREGDVPDAGAIGGGATGALASSAGAASASVRFDGNTAGVLLQVDGHGAAEQWIRAGSMGQSIRLASDGQAVSNQLHLDLVRQSLPANAMLNQNVAQAIASTRGVGGI